MASKNTVFDDANNVSWPLIKYTKLVGTRLEFPVAPGQTMVIIYNKNRCYLSVVFNSSTLEEFSLTLNPRPIVRSRERDIFIQVSSSSGTALTRFRIKFATISDHTSFVEFISFFVKVLPPSNMNISSDFSQPLSQGYTEMKSSQESSQLSLFSSDSSQKSMTVAATLPSESVCDFYSMQNPIVNSSLSANFRCNSASQEYSVSNELGSVDEKIYEVLKSIKHSSVRLCLETAETSPESISGSSGAEILNCLKTSKITDQTVPFNADDMEMAVTHPSMDLSQPVHFDALSNKNYEQKNKRSVGVQTEHCLSISDLLNDLSTLEKYLMAKLEDHQFVQLVEKCSQVYDRVFQTIEVPSNMSSIETTVPTKMRRFCK